MWKYTFLFLHWRHPQSLRAERNHVASVRVIYAGVGLSSVKSMQRFAFTTPPELALVSFVRDFAVRWLFALGYGVDPNRVSGTTFANNTI